MTSYSGHSTAGFVDVLIIGAGHSGLAMSYRLSEKSIEHVILERHEVANSWFSERWESFRLLTPNWQSCLPGYRYCGANPDGFMSRNEIVDFIKRYAAYSQAPVVTHTRVCSVEAVSSGYLVHTDQGTWRARCIVIATGAFNRPVVPKIGAVVPGNVRQLTAHDYKNPDRLDEGGVLVIGASATGIQFADEISRSGRPVTLAVGEHVRIPRRYRGRDIQFWMQLCGLLDTRYDEIDDLERARRVPSPQLVGTDDFRSLDLNSLKRDGVRLTGRLAGMRDGKALFSGSLRNVCKLADLKMNRLLETIDHWIQESGYDEGCSRTERFAPTEVDPYPCLETDLASGEIETVIWATGFRPDYSWLHVPVLNRHGELRHAGGIVDSPGMYVLGLPFLRRRKSSFIHGVADDARDLCEHLVGYLDTMSTPLKLAV